MNVNLFEQSILHPPLFTIMYTSCTLHCIKSHVIVHLVLPCRFGKRSEVECDRKCGFDLSWWWVHNKCKDHDNCKDHGFDENVWMTVGSYWAYEGISLGGVVPKKCKEPCSMHGQFCARLAFIRWSGGIQFVRCLCLNRWCLGIAWSYWSFQITWFGGDLLILMTSLSIVPLV